MFMLPVMSQSLHCSFLKVILDESECVNTHLQKKKIGQFATLIFVIWQEPTSCEFRFHDLLIIWPPKSLFLCNGNDVMTMACMAKTTNTATVLSASGYENTKSATVAPVKGSCSENNNKPLRISSYSGMPISLNSGII